MKKYLIRASLCFAVFLIGLSVQSQARAHQDFHWNWRDWQELDAQESLRNAKLPNLERQAIAAAIAAQLRPIMSDLDIESESQLGKAALDTRIKMIDLNNDGIPEAVTQGMVDCSPTGNCPFWVFQKRARGYMLLIKSYGQTFTVQNTATNGFRDIVVSMHASATESGLTDFRYKNGSYHDVGCYDASWTALEGDTVRELKEPDIAPLLAATAENGNFAALHPPSA